MFKDRSDAGAQLARLLNEYRGNKTLVLGLPRGGVVVAYEVAKILKSPLDVIVVRKIGAPWDPELAIGAISEKGVQFVDKQSIASLGIAKSSLGEIIKQKRIELLRRVSLYRRGKSLPKLERKTVILVDDGLATGATAQAAAMAVAKLKPKKIILAVPVGAYQSIASVKPYVDNLVCIHTPADLVAIGSYYDDFAQVSDAQVINLLVRAKYISYMRNKAK